MRRLLFILLLLAPSLLASDGSFSIIGTAAGYDVLDAHFSRGAGASPPQNYNFGAVTTIQIGRGSFSGAGSNDTLNAVIRFNKLADSMRAIVAANGAVTWDSAQVTFKYTSVNSLTATDQVYVWMQVLRRLPVEGTSSTGSATGDGATWSTYDGVNAWGTAGCLNTTTDIDVTRATDTVVFTNSLMFQNPDSTVVISVPGSHITDTVGNFGWKITHQWASGTPSAGEKASMRSSDHATAAHRPKIQVWYTINAAAGSTNNEYLSGSFPTGVIK